MKAKGFFECSCESCQSACTHKPGWFVPGETEKAAKLLGLSLKDFFDKYLAVDWWQNTEEDDFFILAPAVKGNETGAMYPFKPTGACIFFEEGKCKIHAAKPFECKTLNHTHSPKRHGAVARKWNTQSAKDQIKELLGEHPTAPEPASIFEAWGLNF